MVHGSLCCPPIFRLPPPPRAPQVCAIAAAAEADSEHPLARAVQDYSEQQLERLASGAAAGASGYAAAAAHALQQGGARDKRAQPRRNGEPCPPPSL